MGSCALNSDNLDSPEPQVDVGDCVSLFDRLGDDLLIFIFFYKFQTMVGDESLALQVQELMVRNHCIHVLYLLKLPSTFAQQLPMPLFKIYEHDLQGRYLQRVLCEYETEVLNVFFLAGLDNIDIQCVC